MKINEIERLSGLDRANIRFYEKEGLIKPRRLENGYRDYTKEDLAVLLRIKLLRSLHIPLAEIKALQARAKELDQVLASQMVQLEQEKQDLAYAQEVCRAMQKDRVSYSSLDAGKYLAGIDATAQVSGSSYFSRSEDEDVVLQIFSPWPRFLARMLDVIIYRVLWSAVLAFLFNVNLVQRGTWGNLFDSFFALGLMLIIEPFWLCLFGTTPGKLIFGISIRNSAGGLLSCKTARQRTWAVLGSGMGYNIPVYSLVRLWKSYRLASELEVQPWDLDTASNIKKNRWYRPLAYVMALAATVILSALLISAQRLPPNRGELTIAQFVENHNYYARYLAIDFADVYLAEDGSWQEKPFDGTSYIEVLAQVKPDYHYNLLDGFVKDVSFSVELEDEDSWLGSYNQHKLLITLALAGAQKETGLLSRAPGRLSSQIGDHSFEDFSYTTGGVLIKSSVDYAGYFDTAAGFLVPMENTARQYFKLDFAAAKTHE